MLAPPVNRSNFFLSSVAGILACGALASTAMSQQGVRIERLQVLPGGVVQFGPFQSEVEPVELTDPHVERIAGNTASRFEQVRALAADKNWDEAVDILRELSSDATDRVAALDDFRYVSLRSYCQFELARLPADGLTAYRRRVDPLAERWYRDGVAERNESLLERVVDEMFCSSRGDDALLALGELALEGGDYEAARRYWQQISPLARDPHGKPLWISLRTIDLDKHWPEIERRWPLRSQPPTWLAYPDTDIDLADIRARLTLVSIRAGELDRAAFELDAFRRWHPNSAGRLGGQVGPYVAALERLLESARQWPTLSPQRDWPTFAGAATRSPHAMAVGQLARTAWASAVKLPSIEFEGPRDRGVPFDQHVQAQARESERALAYFPAVVGGLLLYCDASSMWAVELATGKPAVTPDGLLFRATATAGDTNAALLRRATVAGGTPRFSLSVIGHIAYARIGPVATTRLQAAPPPVGERLVGIDLQRDGLLSFQISPDDSRWSFDGAPVGDGRRIFVAMRHGDVTPQAYVACFDAATGRRLWRTPVGAANTPADGNGDEITHNLLTLDGNRIYFNTNLGLVAALDATDGRIAWLRRYDRSSQASRGKPLGTPLHFDRDPSPALVHDGLVIVAPADSPAIFAIDADTGLLAWSSNQLEGALHLLGVTGDNLVVTGHRLWSLDVRSGQPRFAWPESEHSGIRGMGRGVLAGNEVFWPTRKEIYVFDAQTGARTRPPIDLTFMSDCGANLLAANGYLVVAGRDSLIATGPAAAPSSNQNEPPKVAEAK